MREYSESFKSDYFQRLAKLEAGNFWFCSRNRLILWAIKRYFPNASNFFEIGCGTGFVLSAIEKTFPHIALYGSDIYPEGLIFAKQRLRKVSLSPMDAREIFFENKFDLIGAFDILEHIKEDSLVLSQMHKALYEKGGLILTVPQHNFLWSRFDEASCHLLRYNRNELIKKVEQAGFKVVKVTSFISFLFPLMSVLRLLESRRLAKDYDVIRTLEFNPFVNTLLERVLDLERFFITRGISFPFGGSLLLIAIKI